MEVDFSKQIHKIINIKSDSEPQKAPIRARGSVSSFETNLPGPQ